MNDRKRGQISAGLVLITIGLGFYLIDRVSGIGQEAVLLVIGAAFLISYFARKNFGLLIPGCILTGVGLGNLGRNSFLAFGESSLLGLGIGFIAIFVIAKLYERKSHWWPLILGAIMLLMAIPSAYELFEYLWQHWPLILVIIGAAILFGAFRGGDAK